jgi:hypothetical protein
MITEAREQCSLEKYNSGIQKYEELCVFIGNRELTYERQRLDYIDVREKYESLKERMRAEKKRQAELARLEMERKIAEEKAKQEAEIARKKEIEEREKAEAQIIEAKKPSIFASESKQKKIANQQEKNRLDEERILKGYLYDREMADSLISNLLNDGAITQASFVSSNILPKFYSYNHHKSIYPTYAEFVYYVEYWTQGGLYRKGQCDIALDAVILPDNVRIKYNIPVAWKVRYIYIDGVNIWGFN